MSYSKTIVCLANSRKKSGRCIAGKEIFGDWIGGWVRPVSDRETREISEEEFRYQDGQYPKLLDLITIQMKHALPDTHQNENHLIDPQYYWQKTGSFTAASIPRLLETPTSLWAVNCHGYSGMNNRIPADHETGSSLYLIRPSCLKLRVGIKAPEFPDSKRAVRAIFRYNRVEYMCDVTDPYIERTYFQQSDGDYDMGSPYICMSLSEEYNGYCYKLVAAILTQDRCQ